MKKRLFLLMMMLISSISAVLSFGLSSDDSFATTSADITNKEPISDSAASSHSYLLQPDNAHVPDRVVTDISNETGLIGFTSGVTPTGAKTYQIPIDVCPGMNGFTPELSLVYNSQHGNSVLGTGWSISGLPVISRSNRNIYYDGVAKGIAMDSDDAFMLDGVRLILINVTNDSALYETEQGNIKARAWLSGNVVKYFEVFYPDGSKGMFGFTTNADNRLCYPATSLTDLHGNRIDFSYILTDNCYNISKVSYNGASVEFKYQMSRPDPMLFFSGGQGFYESKLLCSIICKTGTTAIGEYTLAYSTRNTRTLLTEIGYKSGGKIYNPIRLYYGTGNDNNTFAVGNTINVISAYHLMEGDGIRIVNGVFGFDGDADALAIMPNRNPYFLYHRDSNVSMHSQNRFLNFYGNREEILLYTGLNDTYVSSKLLTGDGFVDLKTADLDGSQKEYLIRINNIVADNDDQVTFNIYSTEAHTRPIEKYRRTYSFPTVSTDADGGKSVQPKFYYTGDFNGDGKVEIMAVSSHQPFGDKGKSSQCYVFDLLKNKILYQGHVFPFNVEFVGTHQDDAKVAANHTDKLLVIDYDGDGKSDICHIDENGINIYTFDADGDRYTARKITTQKILDKAGLADRHILPGDFNGDGLTDLLVSPSAETDGDAQWLMFNSKGDGTFAKSTFQGPTTPRTPNTGFITQDIDGDDIADLIKYDDHSATAFLIKCNKLGERIPVCNYMYQSVFMPIKSSYGCFTRLIRISDDRIEQYRVSRNDTKESLLTGVVSSLGAIDKNYYDFIGDTDSYKRGNDAVFPYLNISGRLPVVTNSDIYVDGTVADNSSYSYTNAVYHRQGLGFRGFGEIRTFNGVKEFIRTYQPYNHCLLSGEWSRMGERSYTYSVDVQANKITRIRLTEKKEEDYLKDFSAASVFTYAPYGYPTSEHTSYSDGTEVEKTFSYSYNTVPETGYHLGFLTDNSITTTRDGMSYTERMHIPSHSSRLPDTKIYYKDGNQVKREDYDYDSNGNPLAVSLQHYSSPHRHSTRYEYDAYGRTVKETDPMGHTCEFTYNPAGLLTKEKDHKGLVTTYYYDAMGRETGVVNPDGTRTDIIYSWVASDDGAVYSITRKTTGQPEETFFYNALNQEVRHSEKRFDGTVVNVDKIYDDVRGTLAAVSTPYIGAEPSFWDGYLYDSYGRLEYYQSETRDSETDYVYEGNSVTIIENGKSVTKSYDLFGNLVSVKDTAGTVTYNLAPDGLPVSVVAPGNATTAFEYDKYRRRISMDDPSIGTTLYKYDEAGNTVEVTDANGLTTHHTYDRYNRLTRTECPEFATDYSYDADGNLTGVTTTNGTSKSFTYDIYGRLAASKERIAGGKWLQKDYTYSDGNVSSVKYTSQSGVLATENYIYSNGHLSEIKLDNKTTLFKLTSENVYGQPVRITTGNITRKYGYTGCGLPSDRSANGLSCTYQNTSYTFNPKTSYLESRVDSISGTNEGFTYDCLGRLESARTDLFVILGAGIKDSLIEIGPVIPRPLTEQYTSSGSAVYPKPDIPGLEQVRFKKLEMSYDAKGNITSKTDAGTFEYNIPSKPYAVSGLSESGTALYNTGIPKREQYISYCSFSRPESIEENRYTATFTYNGDYDRVKMQLSHNDTVCLTRYYLGGCYEIDETPSSVKEKLYLGGGYYDAVAAYVKEGSKAGVYYILRDYLGSITQIVAPKGDLVQDIRYDAWGRICNSSVVPYSPGNEPELFLGRGYTGHEHLSQFGLVNMNARLYNPVLGRFLSPDPYVQMPDMSQNFNRYSYAMNNPLCYVDESGEFWWLVAGAVIGGVVNLAYKAISGQINSWGDGLAAFGVGAVAGAVGAAVGPYAFAMAGGAAAGGGGFLAGAAAGAASVAATMPIENLGNHVYFGDPLMTWDEYALGIAGGAMIGGTINGARAAYNGRNFWDGSRPESKIGSSYFTNTPVHVDNELKNIDSSTPELSTDDSKVQRLADELKKHLKERRQGQDFRVSIENETQKLDVRVESHNKAQISFPEHNLSWEDVVRHMNIQYYEKDKFGEFQKVILPGQSTNNVHIFLNIVK